MSHIYFLQYIWFLSLPSLYTRSNGYFPSWTVVTWYQNFSILDFLAATDDGGGGDNWSYRTCKAAVKSSPRANQHPTFYRPDALPVAQQTVSKH